MKRAGAAGAGAGWSSFNPHFARTHFEATNENVSPAQREALKKKKDEALDKWLKAGSSTVDTAQQKIDEIVEKMDEDVRNVLAQRENSVLTYESTKAFKNNNSVRDGMDFIGRVVDEAQLKNASPRVVYYRGRAFSNTNTNTIYANPSDDGGTYAHEMGHILENNPEVHKACVEFYEKRTAGEPLISMNEATGRKGYEHNEMTRKDKFLDPYMGKDYTNPFTGERFATEIYSMGLEYLYRYPVRFAREDPEMFKFIVDIAWGNTR